MNLSELYKKRIQELAGIENNIQYLSVEGDMEDEGFDRHDVLTQAYEITKESGVHIYSTKELSDVAYNVDTNESVGALFITHLHDVFSFDVIVKEEYKSRGIGRKLVEIALEHYDEQKEAYGDGLEMEIEVINPHMETLLKSLGFKVTHKLQHGTVLMNR